MAIWDWLVNPVGLTPHGYCLLWAPGLIWLHAVADVVIGLAYFSIPVALGYFAYHRRDLQYRWMVLLFVGFILACGLSHFMAVYTLWVAAYGMEGIIKAITAILSVGTAIVLWPLIPRLLALPTPAELERLNASLSDKVAEQERTHALLRQSEEAVRQSNAELERRVAERTADLSATNDRLLTALRDLDRIRAQLEETVQKRTQALQQRDLLLREVYHRVKNNLQIVDSMILLHLMQAMPDERSAIFLESLRQRVYALGLIHQQLMTSEDLQTFDLAPFIRELTENLMFSSATGEVELELNASPLPVTLDYAVPLGLLVTELVTNSLKHAFPDGAGKLTVEIVRNEPEAQVEVTVADNGKGTTVQADQASAGHHVTSIGRRLIEGLVKQLDGQIRTDSSKGTITRLILPEPRLATT